MMNSPDVFVDLLIFTVELAIIVGFVIFLKWSLGISLDMPVLIRELRELLLLRVNPESLNALFMIGLLVLSLFVAFATTVAAWRKLAYFLLGSDVEAIPAFTMFIILLGVWLLAFILSMSYCSKHRRLMNRDRNQADADGPITR
jgi:hypothetical protein